jgi:hypothetical protein
VTSFVSIMVDWSRRIQPMDWLPSARANSADPIGSLIRILRPLCRT